VQRQIENTWCGDRRVIDLDLIRLGERRPARGKEQRHRE